MSSLFFHPLIKPNTEGTLPPSASWPAARDRALALAVRRHLFDFAAAANELGGSDADECRKRWAELDRQQRADKTAERQNGSGGTAKTAIAPTSGKSVSQPNPSHG